MKRILYFSELNKYNLTTKFTFKLKILVIMCITKKTGLWLVTKQEMRKKFLMKFPRIIPFRILGSIQVMEGNVGQ